MGRLYKRRDSQRRRKEKTLQTGERDRNWASVRQGDRERYVHRATERVEGSVRKKENNIQVGESGGGWVGGDDSLYERRRQEKK